MELTFASYNIHKAVGTDRRRDPERVLSVLHELDADVIALQEADRRLGRRATVLPRQLLAEHHWQVVPVARRPDSIGWHGNAMLVRKGIDVLDAARVDLPMLEPRGAIWAELALDGRNFRVAGMHLDLSGLRRRQQLRAVLDTLEECERACPTVMMGDLNDWSVRRGVMRDLPPGWQPLAPGRSFPSRQPLAMLDRVMLSPEWQVEEARVHTSMLATQASDHLPVLTRLTLPA